MAQFPIPNLAARLYALGATEVLVKHLAPNDNSKNQIYLSGDISELGALPIGEVTYHPSSSKKQKSKKRRGPIFRAPVDLWWLWPEAIVPAPTTKLILYPQYSEVRLSGFLARSPHAPSDLFDIHKRGREPGRVLLFAPLADGRVVAAVFTHDSAEASALRAVQGERYGVMQRFELRQAPAAMSTEDLLLRELRRIHLHGWHQPVRLLPDGSKKPCRGPNCGGVTLESSLGICANGFAEPDFHGWEVKQHGVMSWSQKSAGPVTLMTPEPTGGAYKDEGVEYFLRQWGYADRKGRPDRINFGGVYRYGGDPNEHTGLRLVLQGYDEVTGAFEGDGAVILLDAQEREAASWSFAKLIDHWKRKHAKAVFVQSMVRREPATEYAYGPKVTLAEGGRFRNLLRGFAYGSVYYDPGIKMEDASTPSPKIKRRSQFRVKSGHIHSLYDRTRLVDLLAE